MNKLKNLFPLFFILFFTPVTFLGQHTLTIEIKGLQNNNGQIVLEFTNDHGEKVLGITHPISENNCVIVIENLKPGKYAFKYFHDENKNQKLDINWLGIPEEGFGFSNNAIGKFAPPSLEKTIFELKQDMVLKCTPKYY